MKTNGRWILGLMLCVGTTLAGWAAQSSPSQKPPVSTTPSTQPSQNVPVPEAGETPPAAVQPNLPILPEGVTTLEEPEANTPVPDTRPLSGAQELGGGTRRRTARKYVLPSLSITESYDSNTLPVTGVAGSGVATVVGGGLELHRAAGINSFSAKYEGGATFYNKQSGVTNSYHRLGLQEGFTFRRVSLLLGDEMSYLPESQIGYGHYISDVNQSLLDLRPGINPSQTILTDRNSRISNTVLGEMSVRLDRSSSLTATGSYGLLRFLEGSGLQDGTQIVSSLGYDRKLDVRDSVAVSYNVSQFFYDARAVQVRSQSVQGSYGRRVTGRLALRLSGGPQFLSFENQPGSSGVPVSFAGSATAQYHLRTSDLGASYSRSATGGSGVLTAAQSDSVGASYSRRLLRTVTFAMNFAYAHNTGLAQTSGGVVPRYQTVAGRVSVGHDLGRTMSMLFSYDVQNQTTQNIACSGLSCGLGIRHVFGVGFNWHAQPIRID
jgi:hypothetical protein